MSQIKQAFLNSPYNSKKISSYFSIYESLFQKYKKKKITFIEIGILNGGSLFMWREYFGPQARIIGIDLNPAALKWENFGFEIIIGNQADPIFWKNLKSKVIEVDIILDDGGHTNEQQIITLVEGSKLISFFATSKRPVDGVYFYAQLSFAYHMGQYYIGAIVRNVEDFEYEDRWVKRTYFTEDIDGVYKLSDAFVKTCKELNIIDQSDINPYLPEKN